MLYIIVFLGLLYMGISFIITEKNAPTLLSGYNKMSKEEKARFDLKNYLASFRQFHLFLGLSTLIGGLGLYFVMSKNAGVTFAVLYPILGLVFFILRSNKYWAKNMQRKNNIGAIVLLMTAALVSGLFFWGVKETKINVADTAVGFKGIYGEAIDYQDVTSIDLMQKLPKFTMRVHGFALDGVYKGKFKTADGDIVKLLINAMNKPYIKIEKKNGKDIFFASKNDDNGRIYKELKEKWSSQNDER